jgi:hypothetical protein
MDRRRFNPIVDNASTSGKCPWYNKKNSNPNNKNVGIHSTTICSQSQYGMQGMEEPHILEKKRTYQKKFEVLATNYYSIRLERIE